MSSRMRPVKGDRIECPECHRYVGYWPDRDDYHRCHLMPHLFTEGKSANGWCGGREFNG